MNIAILISIVGGGAGRAAQKVGMYYAEAGHQVFYFVGDYGEPLDYDLKGEIVNTHIKPIDISYTFGKAIAFANVIKAAWKMRVLKKKYNIETSISFMEDFSYLNALSKGKDTVIIRVGTIISERFEFKGMLYSKKMINRVFSMADKIVALSKDGRDEMINLYGLSPKKVVIIPNSSPSRKGLSLAKWQYGDNAIVFLGRFHPVKQVDKIIRSFRLVAKKNMDARLVLVGNGQLESYLRGLCRLYGLQERVIFVGHVRAVEHYIEHAKLFVMASRVEGFPNSILEAMSYGVPIVATDAPGGMRDVLLGESRQEHYGILTSAMPIAKPDINAPLIPEEEELGRAMLSVLEDDALHEELHEKSLQRANFYNIDNVMKLWNDIINLRA